MTHSNESAQIQLTHGDIGNAPYPGALVTDKTRGIKDPVLLSGCHTMSSDAVSLISDLEAELESSIEFIVNNGRHSDRVPSNPRASSGDIRMYFERRHSGTGSSDREQDDSSRYSQRGSSVEATQSIDGIEEESSTLRNLGEVGDLLDFNVGRFLVGDIHPNTAERRAGLVEFFTNIHRGRNALSKITAVIAAEHGDHIHVIHGCNSPRICKCGLNTSVRPISRRILVKRPEYFTVSYRENLRRYLSEGSMVSGSTNRQLLLWSNQLGVGELFVNPGATAVRPSDGQTADGVPIRPGNLGGRRHDVFECISGEQEQVQMDTDQQRMEPARAFNPTKFLSEKLLEEWTPSWRTLLKDPDLEDWQREKIVKSNKYIKEYFDAWRLSEFHRTSDWTLDDIFDSFGERVPSFGETNRRMSTPSESLIALKNFLESQFGEQWRDTFRTICKIFDKDNGKQNTLVFVGPVSCGKTWFMDGFAKLARFVGHPTNFIRGDRFSWNNCQNSRLLRFDECSIPIDASTWIEKFKEICGGQATEVDTKYGTGYVLEPTPLFVSANQDIFSRNPMVRHQFIPARMFYHTLYPWPNANELTRNKQMNPLAILLLKNELESEIQ